MNYKQCRLLLILLTIPSFAWSSAFDASDRGTTAAQFLKLGVGARAIGLGEAYTALADEASALYWNPAAMTRIEKRSATFMHSAYLDSSFFDFGAIAGKLGSHDAVGLAFQRLSAGSIAETDQSGAEVGKFNPNDLAVTVGAAHEISGFSLGANIKYIQSEIVSTAKTWAVDLGLLSPGMLDDRLRLGAAISNLGGQMKFDKDSENLPVMVRLGGAYKLRKDWALTLDGVIPRDNHAYMALGTEYQKAVTESMTAAGRLGFNSRTIGDLDGLNGLSIGLGLGMKFLSVDYAILPIGTLGITHYISLSTKF